MDPSRSHDDAVVVELDIHPSIQSLMSYEAEGPRRRDVVKDQNKAIYLENDVFDILQILDVFRPFFGTLIASNFLFEDAGQFVETGILRLGFA